MLKDLKTGCYFGVLYKGSSPLFLQVSSKLKNGMLSCDVINGNWQLYLDTDTGIGIVAKYPDTKLQISHVYIPANDELRLPIHDYNKACDIIMKHAVPFIPQGGTPQ